MLSNKIKNHTKTVESYLDQEKITFSKYMFLLSALLFVVFGFVDLFSFTINIEQAHQIRAYTVLYLFSAFFLVYFRPIFFLKNYFSIMVLSFLITSSSIQFIINLATINDAAHTIYFAGLMLIIMSLFAWTFLSVLEAGFIALLILAIYTGSALFYSNEPAIFVIASNIGTSLFLASSAIIGLISSLMRDKYLRNSLLLQMQLKESLLFQEAETNKHKVLSQSDVLTGLPNRRGAMRLLNKQFKEAKTDNNVVVVCFLDLNGFKLVNDTYGHNVGDEILIISANRISSKLRKSDLFARLSGDEFLIAITINENKLKLIDLMFKNIKLAVDEPMHTSKGNINQSISLGCAVYPYNGNTVEAVIEVADKRMYKDKASKTETKGVRDLGVEVNEFLEVSYK